MVEWICATSAEMAAAQGMLDERHSSLQQDSRKDINYTLGRISDHNIVLACLSSRVDGPISAAFIQKVSYA